MHRCEDPTLLCSSRALSEVLVGTTRAETFQMQTAWLFVLYLYLLPCYNIPQYSPNRAPRLNSLLCLLRYINIEVLSLLVGTDQIYQIFRFKNTAGPL
jgi:hypothetical protein